MQSYPGFETFPAALFLIASLFSSAPAIAEAVAHTGVAQAGTTGETQDAAAPATSLVDNSVVKVFSTLRYPDLSKPWTKEAPQEVSGTGVVIAGKRILTNAHVILYASQIQVQASQAGDKLSATVEVAAPGIDLAILKLDDESFFDRHPPMPSTTTLPELKEAVMAYGFPGGGNSLSITKGIVSRIEFAAYDASVRGLRIQIDAAINPGNSGGPAVVGDKMIGLAFSHLGGADNIGYIIPCEEIELFLHDVADGHYDGKPGMFDDLQTLENPALRSYLKLDKGTKGIVVHSPERTDADYPLKQWDLITKIGDTVIDDQGMIKLRDNLRVRFQYEIQNIAKDGRVALTIVRDGKEALIELPVSSSRPMLIPDLDGGYPSYFVYGPLVFSRATSRFLWGISHGSQGALVLGSLASDGSPLITRLGDKPAFEGEALVIVSSPLFPDKLGTGYSNPIGEVVKSVNGTEIRNLGHLVEVLRDCKDEFVTFEFVSRHAETPVFRRTEVLAAMDGILTDNGVRSQGSPDMMAIWNAHGSR
jgi:S1-C subfamily serine protease